jgi:ketosteroid isomerase-like protein
MAEINNLVKQWVDMWNNYDINLVAELFSNDERVTYFSSERTQLIKGINNLLEHHKSLGFVPGGKASGNKLWLEKIDYENHGNSDLVKGIWLFRKEGSRTTQKGPVTLVYFDEGNGSKIFHAHFSNY